MVTLPIDMISAINYGIGIRELGVGSDLPLIFALFMSTFTHAYGFIVITWSMIIRL